MRVVATTLDQAQSAQLDRVIYEVQKDLGHSVKVTRTSVIRQLLLAAMADAIPAQPAPAPRPRVRERVRVRRPYVEARA